jgi:glycosyltransferase involved in cell wall biosynthesis
MCNKGQAVRVLYSFPLKLGAGRVCTTAWYQVEGLAAAGAEVTVFPAAIARPLPPEVKVKPTMAWGKVRVPNRLLGRMRYGEAHDRLVANRLEKMAGQIDIVHTWPVGALHTLKAAARLGIPAVLERCNAHTRFGYEVVNAECERLGVPLPSDHEHAYNPQILGREEEEYNLAYRLLCPSDFVVKTFLDKGFPKEKLARHIYGFDEKVFHPSAERRDPKQGLTMISVGVCAVRKGLHFALEAWLQSSASRDGTFLIAGEFLPAYRKKLAPMLAHPSVKVLGHRQDVPELMRKSDILVLATIEEGSALVTSEARGSGCVLVVSEAAGAVCTHLEDALVHRVGDVKMLTEHITSLDRDRALLERLRAASIRTVPAITWRAAGVRLRDVYRGVIANHRRDHPTGNPVSEAMAVCGDSPP